VDAAVSRACWRTTEPVHAQVYFSPEAQEEYAALGLDLAANRDGTYPANPFLSNGSNPLQTAALVTNDEDVWRLMGSADAVLKGVGELDKPAARRGLVAHADGGAHLDGLAARGDGAGAERERPELEDIKRALREVSELLRGILLEHGEGLQAAVLVDVEGDADGAAVAEGDLRPGGVGAGRGRDGLGEGGAEVAHAGPAHSAEAPAGGAGAAEA